MAISGVETAAAISGENREQRLGALGQVVDARDDQQTVAQAGRKTEEGILIDFPITRQDLADMTGSTLHTVSRTLSAWEDRGLVRSARRRVVVVAPHRLRLIADGTPEG